MKQDKADYLNDLVVSSSWWVQVVSIPIHQYYDCSSPNLISWKWVQDQAAGIP
jgi:hypothetical protein